MTSEPTDKTTEKKGPTTLEEARALGMTEVMLDEYRKYVGITNSLSFEYRKEKGKLAQAEQDLGDMRSHLEYIHAEIAKLESVVDKSRDRCRILHDDLETAREERRAIAKDEKVAKKMDTLLSLEREIRSLRRKLMQEFTITLLSGRSLVYDGIDEIEAIQLARHDIPTLASEVVAEISHKDPDDGSRVVLKRDKWVHLFDAPMCELE